MQKMQRLYSLLHTYFDVSALLLVVCGGALQKHHNSQIEKWAWRLPNSQTLRILLHKANGHLTCLLVSGRLEHGS